MDGYIDQVKIRIRTHCPNDVCEREFKTIGEAIYFLNAIRGKNDNI